jgi:hypothetical protein
MTAGNWTRRPSKGNRLSKADHKTQADDAVAAFLARGGSVKQMPAVVATTFACANCGHTGILGIAEGKSPRCPKCREPLRA